MTLPRTPLQSAFGRRLLALFVGCALVPTAVLTLVSFGHVKQELYTQSERRLLQANQALGSALFERLLPNPRYQALLRSIGL